MGFLIIPGKHNKILINAGMDAQVSYAFHSERKLYPEKFKKQIANQVSTVIYITLNILIDDKFSMYLLQFLQV